MKANRWTPPFLTRLLSWRPHPKSNPASPECSRWPIVQRFDVVARPVAVAHSPDGREVAVDYSTFRSACTPDVAIVPIEWVRALGAPIDAARFDGLILAQRFKGRTPIVLEGDDRSAVIITGKGALTRRRPGPGGAWWRRGMHIPLDEYRRLRHVVGARAQAVIAESQRPGAFMTHAQRGDAIAAAIVDGLGAHVYERFGWSFDDDARFSDDDIAAAKRQARALLDRARDTGKRDAT